jgi:hypothetical protein
VTTLEARETTRPLVGGKLNGRAALVTRGTRGFGTAIGGILAGRLGRLDGLARVVDFVCAGVCSSITGQVWAPDGSQGM